MAGRRSSSLHFASGYGRKDIVEYLLANGANISLRDDGGLNPLVSELLFSLVYIILHLFIYNCSITHVLLDIRKLYKFC